PAGKPRQHHSQKRNRILALRIGPPQTCIEPSEEPKDDRSQSSHLFNQRPHILLANHDVLVLASLRSERKFLVLEPHLTRHGRAQSSMDLTYSSLLHDDSHVVGFDAASSHYDD